MIITGAPYSVLVPYGILVAYRMLLYTEVGPQKHAGKQRTSKWDTQGVFFAQQYCSGQPCLHALGCPDVKCAIQGPPSYALVGITPVCCSSMLTIQLVSSTHARNCDKLGETCSAN